MATIQLHTVELRTISFGAAGICRAQVTGICLTDAVWPIRGSLWPIELAGTAVPAKWSLLGACANPPARGPYLRDERQNDLDIEQPEVADVIAMAKALGVGAAKPVEPAPEPAPSPRRGLLRR